MAENGRRVCSQEALLRIQLFGKIFPIGEDPFPTQPSPLSGRVRDRDCEIGGAGKEQEVEAREASEHGAGVVHLREVQAGLAQWSTSWWWSEVSGFLSVIC